MNLSGKSSFFIRVTGICSAFPLIFLSGLSFALSCHFNDPRLIHYQGTDYRNSHTKKHYKALFSGQRIERVDYKYQNQRKNHG